MRRSLVLAIFPALCLLLCPSSWIGTAGFGSALAQEEPKKPVPAPQPIPPRHERGCEGRAHADRAGARIRDCVERRVECPCARPCVGEGDRCGTRCAPREACDVDRDEPCRLPKRDKRD
jgi:hypothetical protein